jgi:GntR family transcriptional regulator
MMEDKPESLGRLPALDGAQPIGFRPLYQQVKAVLLRRLVDGVWAPGAGIPSEGQLAGELGVSQGTVRKALDELAAENLLVRRQGRGTFIAEHDERRILFQFFKIVLDDGVRRFPDSILVGTAVQTANKDERDALRLAEDERIVRIKRLRALDGTPMILETLSVPERLFPDIAQGPIPNNLYALYATRYGITIAHAREKLKAVTLSNEEASALRVVPGHPALLVDRVALAIDGQPVERRLSLCLTEDAHYLSELR